MIQSVTVVNHESKTFEFLLNDISESGLYISNIEGLGYPSATISNSETFNNAVSIYGNTVKQPRNIVITFGVSSFGFNTVEQARELIYEMLPSSTELYMEFKSDEKIRNIIGYVENITPIIFDQKESVQVSIICPNPYFYSGGKVEISSDNAYKNFQFTEWFEQLGNVGDNGTSYLLIEKPIDKLPSLDETYKIVEGYSRFENPTGYELLIENTGFDWDSIGESYENWLGTYSFNKVIIEYSGGTIVIDPKGDIPFSKIGNPDYLNFFDNKKILITNDYDDQNIYEVDENGIKKSILDILVIEGDFINLNVGYNIIKTSMYGVAPKITENRYTIWGIDDENRLINSKEGNAWYVYMKSDFYYDIIDMFSSESDAYLGSLIVTSSDFSEVKSDERWDTEEDEYGNEYAVFSYYKLPKTTGGGRIYGIYVTRNEEKQGNANEFEENGYYYTIWLKTVYQGTAASSEIDFVKETPVTKIFNTLSVELINRQGDDVLYRMFYNFNMENYTGPTYREQIKFSHNFHYRLDNPLNKTSYILAYGNINNFSVQEKYDEMFDAF